jgi:hypothetical protein
MNRIAFIKDNGFINHSFVPDAQDVYVAGDEVDGLTIQFFPYSEDPLNWIDTKFWDFDEGEWADIPEKPSGEHYVWSATEKTYVMDRGAMEREVRLERNKKLADTDWMMVRDTPKLSDEVIELRTYRQALRDLMASIDFDTLEDTSTITWPVPPDFV